VALDGYRIVTVKARFSGTWEKNVTIQFDSIKKILNFCVKLYFNVLNMLEKNIEKFDL